MHGRIVDMLQSEARGHPCRPFAVLPTPAGKPGIEAFGVEHGPAHAQIGRRDELGARPGALAGRKAVRHIAQCAVQLHVRVGGDGLHREAAEHDIHRPALHPLEIALQEVRVVDAHVGIEEQHPVGGRARLQGVARGAAAPVLRRRDQRGGQAHGVDRGLCVGRQRGVAAAVVHDEDLDRVRVHVLLVERAQQYAGVVAVERDEHGQARRVHSAGSSAAPPRRRASVLRMKVRQSAALTAQHVAR